ncbi:hypothetical protein C8R44DRAFT_898028, partial [Mycena epipterygia]
IPFHTTLTISQSPSVRPAGLRRRSPRPAFQHSGGFPPLDSRMACALCHRLCMAGLARDLLLWPAHVNRNVGHSTHWPPPAGDDIERITGYNFLTWIPPVVHKISLDFQGIMVPDTCSDVGGYMNTLDLHPLTGKLNDSDGSEHSSDTEQEAQVVDLDYYRSQEEFNYSPPPIPVDVEVDLPALLVWERTDGRQTWLALEPRSPFSVYIIRHASYAPGEIHQYISWIFWLESQLRKIHRQSDGRGT